MGIIALKGGLFLLIFLVIPTAGRYTREIQTWGSYEDILPVIKPARPKGRISLNDVDAKWQNNTLHYVFDSGLDSDLITLIQSAMQDISTATCINFTTRTSETDYVKFTAGDGCHSYVGRKGGEQIISLGSGCHSKGVILHELLHALGFLHTHSRPDRDANIRVHFDNVREEDYIYFARYQTTQVNMQDSPYDFKSILHWPKKALSMNQADTMTAEMNPNMPLGQIDHLTPIDIQLVNDLYSCGIEGCFHALIGLDILPDYYFSASSELNACYASEGRLHNQPSTGYGAWCAQSWDTLPYLEIYLGTVRTIKAIATQGASYVGGAFVASFDILYRNYTSENYTLYSQVLVGNSDQDSVRYTELPTPITARHIRFEPLSWHYLPCMRVELYGCRML